jgi:hypothetical protein
MPTIYRSSELAHGTKLQIGDDAWSVGSYVGKVLGRRKNGEIVIPTMNEGTSPNCQLDFPDTYGCLKWPADKPMVYVEDKNGIFSAWWSNEFTSKCPVGRGDTVEGAIGDLIDKHCRNYQVLPPVEFPKHELVTSPEKEFQVVVRRARLINGRSQPYYRWEACFDYDWMAYMGVGETKEEALEALNEKTVGLKRKEHIIEIGNYELLNVIDNTVHTSESRSVTAPAPASPIMSEDTRPARMRKVVQL